MNQSTDLKIREALLLKAFTDKAFETELEGVQQSLGKALRNFVEHLKKTLRPEQKIYENVETRVKSRDSFQEKLYRKDYIKHWVATGDRQTNQRMIASSLPDLLGFRINCFFWQDEKVIYDTLQEYYRGKRLTVDDPSVTIELDFTENTTQKNGHNIYKVSGTYHVGEREYCFEIQIKSIMHNIWGEVEHKTIYKNRNYDADIENKVAITEEIFNILQASDKQLVSLFKKRNDEKELTYALFFEKTKETIQKKSGTDILARHYKAFFEVFDDNGTQGEIKRYVAYALLSQDYQRILPATFGSASDKAKKLCNLIKASFLEYNLKCLYYICGLIYDFKEGYTEFLQFLSGCLLEQYLPDEQESDYDDYFDDEEEKNTGDDMSDIINMLADKIGGRIKNAKNTSEQGT